MLSAVRWIAEQIAIAALLAGAERDLQTQIAGSRIVRAELTADALNIYWSET